MLITKEVGGRSYRWGRLQHITATTVVANVAKSCSGSVPNNLFVQTTTDGSLTDTELHSTKLHGVENSLPNFIEIRGVEALPRQINSSVFGA